MKIWFDTEFIEDGKTIDLVSIGMVREDGDTLYFETDSYIPGKASQWVKDNVLVHLTGQMMPRDVIAREIVEFSGEKPEFWAYYADYDWVALCQLFGTMMQLPEGWPMYCRDVKQLCDELGNPELPKQTSTEHHALADAKWTKKAWEFLAASSVADHQSAISEPQEAVVPRSAAPAEQGEVAGWQFKRHDGKWFNCHVSPTQDVIDANPQVFRPVYASPPPHSDAPGDAEPIAWISWFDGNCDATARKDRSEDWIRRGRKVEPLYAAPPRSDAGGLNFQSSVDLSEATRSVQSLYDMAGPSQCDAVTGGVSFSEEETYALFLILDTLARVRRGDDQTVNYMRERTLPAYREWHKQNPHRARQPLAIPSAEGNTP